MMLSSHFCKTLGSFCRDVIIHIIIHIPITFTNTNNPTRTGFFVPFHNCPNIYFF